MKKIRTDGPVLLRNRLRKSFMIMKLTFLLCMACVYASFANVYSQQRISIRMGEVTLKEVLSEFQRQTHKIVIYSDDSFTAERKITGDFTDMEVERFLETVLKGSGMGYKIENDYVMIVPLKNTLETIPQNRRTIKGEIVDETGAPVPGVSVVVTGTTTGVSTDINGKFTLMVGQDAKTITVSFVGMATQQVNIQDQMKIVLLPDQQKLDEVVVVGYNSVKKSQMTGAVDVVKGKELEFMSAPTLESRLQGQTAGVMISSGSGQPGSDYLTIRVRGTGSINGSNTPLYIMDGVMVEPGQFAALNSNDIADIQVLKDASASAIYGSRGANGVIVITTKGGHSGKTRINYRNQFGFSYLVDYVDMMNSEENLQYQLQCAISDPSRSDFPLMGALYREYTGEATEADNVRLAKARATNTDWMDEMTRVGFLNEHSLTFDGGNDKTNFFISASYLSQDGILKKSGMKRYSGRFNIDHKANQWLNIGLKLTTGYSQISFNDPSGSSNRTSYLNPWFTSLLAYPYESPDDWYNGDNPTLLTKYLDNNTNKLKMVGAAYAKANITNWLSFKTNFGMDFMYNRSENTRHRDHPKSQTDHGSYSHSSSELARYTWTNQLNFNKEIAEGHIINAVVGMEMFQGKWFTAGYTGYDLNSAMMDSPAGIGDKIGASEYPPQINGGRTMSNLLSFFAQASYSLGNKYNFSASLRHDTSSKFYEDNASAMFWSVGASWNISQENWLRDVEWLSLLKLRASYGTTGNQDGVSDFGTFDGYTNSSYNGESGYSHSQIGNPSLKWETSAQTNLGVDISVFDQRLGLTADFYYIKTKDLYMNKNISLTSGFGSMTVNAGSIVNKGVELGLNATPVSMKGFTWNIGINFTYNKNKLVDLGTWTNAENKYLNGYSIYEKNRPLGTWCIEKWADVNPDNGIVRFYKEDGVTKTEDIAEGYKFSDYGTSEIPIFGGFHTTLTYKGLSLNAQFTYAYDYTVMNTMRWYIYNHHFNGNKPVEMLNMWMEPGDVTNIPRFGANTQPSPMASQFLEDASYLRLKSLRVAYSLPKNWLKKTRVFENVVVYAQGENLVTWTKYTGADPEVSGGYDYMSFPKPRNFTFGLDINF